MIRIDIDDREVGKALAELQRRAGQGHIERSKLICAHVGGVAKCGKWMLNTDGLPHVALQPETGYDLTNGSKLRRSGAHARCRVRYAGNGSAQALG